MKYLGIALCLSVLNVLYQATLATSPDYIDAFRISYFQSGALLIVWIMETYPE